MRVVPYILCVTACLGLSGCSIFKRSTPPANRTGPDPLLPRADGTNRDRPSDVRTAAATESNNPVVKTSGSTGILAGQIIDSFSRPPGEAYILVSCPKQGGEKEKKPLEVLANAQGYFTISGLRPGHHYQLIARCRDGKRMLAGTTWATPPNVRVLIRISEDFVTKNTPPIPPPPVWPGAKEDKATSAAVENPKPAEIKGPERASAATDAGWKAPEIQTPGPGSSFDRAPAVANEAPPIPIHTERIAENNGNQTWSRNGIPAYVPGLANRGSETAGQAIVQPSGEPAPVPSCVLAGKQVVNFALNDLDDRPWELRNRRGKLVLLDFWGTWCLPCRQTVPHLRILQERYGTAGLEVIGIAYERKGSLPQQRRQVDDVCQHLHINYKVLLGSRNCPVKTKLGVNSFPTLILLDQNGWIIWQHEGALDPDELKDLEMRIANRLGAR